MKTLNTLASLALAALTIGCAHSPRPLVEFDPIDCTLWPEQNDSLISLPSAPQSQATKDGGIAKHFGSTEYIVLEATPESLVGQINDVQIVGDRLFVISSTIKVFNRQGHYLYQVGAEGNGPGEYGRLSAVSVQPDAIYITDGYTGKIIKYGLDGKCLTEWRLNARVPDSFCILADSVVVGSHSGTIPYEPYQCLKWTNLSGQELNTALPNNTGESYVAGMFFAQQDTTALFCYALSDTIYQVGPHSLKPAVATNIFDLEAQTEYFKLRPTIPYRDLNKFMFDSKGATTYMTPIHVGNKWVISYQRGRNSYVSVIDEECHHYLSSSIEGGMYLYTSERYLSAVGDTLIGYLPMEIFEYLDKEKQSIFVTHISAAVGHDVTPDEVPEYNPLIVLHQIK